MLNILAQAFTDSVNPTVTVTSEQSSGFALFGGFMLLVWLAVFLVSVVALWKVFEKAGVAGWKAIIPIYNSWILAEIAGKPGWWGLVSLLAFIPFLGPLVVLVVYVILSLELAKRFGKSPLFAVFGLVIFSLIGLLILGFGDAKYQGTPYDTLGEGKSTPPAAPKAGKNPSA